MEPEHMINRLVQARKELKGAQATLDDLMAAHPEVSAAQEAVKEARKVARDLESAIRGAGSVDLEYGRGIPDVLGVKTEAKPGYDMDLAIEWASRHGLTGLLLLDVKAFEALTLKNPGVIGRIDYINDNEFNVYGDDLYITVRQVQSVIIPKDLQPVEIPEEGAQAESVASADFDGIPF